MNQFSNNTAMFQKIYFPNDPKVDLTGGPSLEVSSENLLLTGDLDITGSATVAVDLDVTGDIAGASVETTGNITAGGDVSAVDGAFSGDITVDNITASTNVIGVFAEFSGGGLFEDNVAIENGDSDAVLQVDILNVGQSASLPATEIYQLIVSDTANINSLTVDTEIVSSSTIVDLIAQTISVEQDEYGAGGTIDAEGIISSGTEITSPMITADNDVDVPTLGITILAHKYDGYGSDGYLENGDVLGLHGFRSAMHDGIVLAGMQSATTENHEDGKYGTGLFLLNTPNQSDEQAIHVALLNEYTFLFQDTIMGDGKYQYWGNPEAEGTIRLGLDDGNFVIQQLLSSVWTTLYTTASS